MGMMIRVFISQLYPKYLRRAKLERSISETHTYRNIYPITLKSQKSAYPQNYSTVAFVRCNDAVFPADVVFKFTLTCRSPALTGNYYSDYQFFLYETITGQREKGRTFDRIAEWLNKKGYLSVR